MNLLGVPHSNDLCPRCAEVAKKIRRETLMPVPEGVMAPRSRVTNQRICFDCASAEGLGFLEFEMARIATGNDRQEKLRLPGVPFGLPQVRLARPGDLERLQRWQLTLPASLGCDSGPDLI